MSTVSHGSVLILGYGNPGRQDDGLGPALAEQATAWGLPELETDADYQLTIEDGAAVAGHSAVVFVDAAIDGPEPFTFRPVAPATEITFTTHSVSPESVLAVAQNHFGGAPEAWVLAVRGYAFEFQEGLTPRAQANFDKACEFVQSWVRARRECR